MKRIRMDQEAYADGSVFAVTIATADRRLLLTDSVVAESCLQQLRNSVNKCDASVYAYCFMPDHAHLLASVPGGTILVMFVRHFKQLSAYRFRRLAGYEGQTLWQRRFFDHALRREEEIGKTAEYIWSNPVRAGLVEDAARYTYSGSLISASKAASGSEDPDLPVSLHDQPRRVGEGLQTLAVT